MTRLLVGALVMSTNFPTEQHEQANGILLLALRVDDSENTIMLIRDKEISEILVTHAI